VRQIPAHFTNDAVYVNIPFPGDPADPDLAAGRMFVAHLYDLALSQGINSLVQQDNTVVSGRYSFKTDSQTITIPPDVTVMAIAPTQTKLAPGTSVVIPVKKQPDGTLTSSTVMLSPPRTRPD